MTDDKRMRAYRAASHLTREGLRRDAPERAAVLDAVPKSDVVVVSGIYDHVEDVLDALDVQHTVIAPPDLDRMELRPAQLLVVNCPGQVSPRAVSRIRAFVEAGGSLFTTDWALRHVVEAAFPGVLAFNERPTGDDVVRVEVRDPDDVYVKGVMDGRDGPQWWLEASSYPMRILDPSRVQVLITSRELGARYGEEPVAVRFGWGEGEVFHMISHYYLQRTETRTIRHQAGAGGVLRRERHRRGGRDGGMPSRSHGRRRGVGPRLQRLHVQHRDRQEGARPAEACGSPRSREGGVMRGFRRRHWTEHASTPARVL
jgi:hypothetical protein